MNESERFERAMKLFQRACDLPAPERSGFLAEACGADVDLRAEVESLLEHDAQERETILEAEDGGVAQALVSAATGTAGAFAGYEVIRELSHGGLTVEGIAELEGVSDRTVKKDWRGARAWLRRELGEGASA